MRNISFLTAFLFLVIGIAWMFSIYQRSSNFISMGNSRGSLEQEVSLIKQYQELTEEKIEKKVSISTSKFHLNPIHVRAFVGIVAWELLVALMYIISGLALLRLYPFGRVMVLWTLLFELWFKIMVIFYQKVVAAPLEGILKSTNILKAYFMPSSDWVSSFSGNISGLNLVGDQGGKFLLYYLIFLFSISYLFSKNEMIKTFGR